MMRIATHDVSCAVKVISRSLSPRHPGRVYYLRKQAEGKTRKEAMRALKRQISDAIYQRLINDTRS